MIQSSNFLAQDLKEINTFIDKHNIVLISKNQ